MVQVMTTMLYVGGGLVGLLFVLLAMPGSKLRDVLMPIAAWVFAALCGAYVVMPLDVLPDFIPIAGFIDDAGAAIAGIASVATALSYRGK
jgi:uncharacterized membrane protein YkvA (DUF1232 family)